MRLRSVTPLWSRQPPVLMGLLVRPAAGAGSVRRKVENLTAEEQVGVRGVGQPMPIRLDEP